MQSRPSRIAEAAVSVFVPRACREEIVGDLHERFTSYGQYALDALRTVPLVILSRIRRTMDLQIFLMQALAAYLSFVSAAWLAARGLLSDEWGMLRLAFPAAMALVGLILDDAYASPGQRSARNLARGPALGMLLAAASQELLRVSSPDWALPRMLTSCGCAMTFLLFSAVRIWFPPVTKQPG